MELDGILPQEAEDNGGNALDGLDTERAWRILLELGRIALELEAFLNPENGDTNYNGFEPERFEWILDELGRLTLKIERHTKRLRGVSANLLAYLPMQRED